MRNVRRRLSAHGDGRCGNAPCLHRSACPMMRPEPVGGAWVGRIDVHVCGRADEEQTEPLAVSTFNLESMRESRSVVALRIGEINLVPAPRYAARS